MIFLKPEVGKKVKAVVQDVQHGHISLTISKVLSAIVQLSPTDERYEVQRTTVEKTAKADDSMSEEDLEVSEDEAAQVTRQILFDKKRDRKYKSGDSIRITVERLVIDQGTLMLFCKL